MAVFGQRQRKECPFALVLEGALDLALAHLREFGERPPESLKELYTTRRLKRDFADGLCWLRDTWHYDPEPQQRMLGYFLYSHMTAQTWSSVPEELRVSKCLAGLPWPSVVLGDEGCALDLVMQHGRAVQVTAAKTNQKKKAQECSAPPCVRRKKRPLPRPLLPARKKRRLPTPLPRNSIGE